MNYNREFLSVSTSFLLIHAPEDKPEERPEGHQKGNHRERPEERHQRGQKRHERRPIEETKKPIDKEGCIGIISPREKHDR